MSTSHPSSVIQMNLHSEDILDAGECQNHRRIIECFCTDCKILICASCLMFDQHKGHSVCKIEEASNSIRASIDSGIKSGIFKVENSENVLLDVRHTKLTTEETKNRVIKEIDDIFKQFLQETKNRRLTVLKEVESFFAAQFEILAIEEEKWQEKQRIASELLEIAKNKDDIQIVRNSHFILDSIDDLSSEKEYHKIQLINTINHDFCVQTEQKSLILKQEQVLNAFKNFITKGEIIDVQFRS